MEAFNLNLLFPTMILKVFQLISVDLKDGFFHHPFN